MINYFTDKIYQASDYIVLASKISKRYYKKPLYINYSGGKDSDVLLDITINCLDKDDFIVVNMHTSVDYPDTVYHIRNKFKNLKSEGFNCEIIYPRYDDGTQKTMWNLIEKKHTLPTRLIRFCCEELKENNLKNVVNVVGVRQSESYNRSGRDIFLFKEKKKDIIYYNYNKVLQSYNDSLIYSDVYDCKFIENAKNNKNMIVNPIYYFRDNEIWDYIRHYNIIYNPLYDKGYKRVGCVGCPMGNNKNELEKMIKYKNIYLQYINKIKDYGVFKKYNSVNDIYKWWVQDYDNPDQLTINNYINS